jgi:hypothetical protein
MCYNCSCSDDDQRAHNVKTVERDVTEELVQRHVMKLIGLLTLVEEKGSEYIPM